MNFEDVPEFIPIPEELWSFETGEPFDRCFHCGETFITLAQPYYIEKAFDGDEIVFEYALCTNCHSELFDSLSTESRENIETYFAANLDVETYIERQMPSASPDYNRWVSHCMIKKYPRAECNAFQLIAQCNEFGLNPQNPPFIVSSQVIEEIIDLLSTETLGILDDFTGKILGIDLPKNTLIL